MMERCMFKGGFAVAGARRAPWAVCDRQFVVPFGEERSETECQDMMCAQVQGLPGFISARILYVMRVRSASASASSEG